ncbi:MAG TPA: TIM barrel protein [Opitutaceae bacterium]|nr:TIM barrel protein [Opitutaceae bacterium]
MATPTLPLTRRRFLELSAAASVLSTVSPLRAASERAPFSFRYLLASSLYGGLSLTEILPEVKKIGATAIDLWPRKHGTQREEADAWGREKLQAALSQHGVKVEVTTRFDLGPFGLADEIKFLHAMGGSLIVTGGKGPADATGTVLKAEVKKLVEAMKPTLERAGDAGVKIAIENHSDNIINTPDSLRWLVEFGRGLPLGVALAPYHLPQDAQLMANLIRDLDSSLLLFYGWEYGKGCMKPMPKNEELMQMPGRGTLDFKRLVQALRDIRFRGWTEIFMHPTPRGIPILDTASEVTAEINRARRYLETLPLA